MTQLSDHFTLEEATLSQTASRLKLFNVPSDEVIVVMRNTAKQMERVRALLGSPITVSSWFRSVQVNHAIGGVPKSQHITGEAVDFICPAAGTCAEICRKIIHFPELVSFDQLILEHTWVHISFSSDPTRVNRKQVLSLLDNGAYSSGLTDSSGRSI